MQAIIDAQPALRDRVALSLLARLGLRKAELRLLRWRDIDLERGEVRVRGKGGTITDMPIVYEELLRPGCLSLESEAKPEEYLLYPVRVGNAHTKPNLKGVVEAPRPADGALDDAPLVQALPTAGGCCRLPDARATPHGGERVPPRDG